MQELKCEVSAINTGVVSELVELLALEFENMPDSIKELLEGFSGECDSLWYNPGDVPRDSKVFLDGEEFDHVSRASKFFPFIEVISDDGVKSFKKGRDLVIVSGGKYIHEIYS